MRIKKILIFLSCGMTSYAQAEDVRVAVASNFINPMRAIAQGFEESTTHKVKLSFGSSGKFVAQIQHGAPFDIFLSADQDKVYTLNQLGLTLSESQFTYAYGSLVLWSNKEGFTSAEQYQRRLRSKNFNKLAIANPKLAPYGLAAIQALEHMGLRKTTQAKWVQGENIAQTYQFVSSGNADMGFVALSQLVQSGHIQKKQPSKGSIWVIPNEFHQPIRQDAVLLKRGKNNEAAKTLLNFMQSDQGRAIIELSGYSLPENSFSKIALPKNSPSKQ